jgi:hypothetical protein
MKSRSSLFALAVLALLPLAARGEETQAERPPGAVVLFDGKDTSAWTHEGGKPCAWPVVDGAMEVGKGNIVTQEAYQDFKLHVEFRVPQAPPEVKGQGRGNSGVYIQRRYEVQILDSFGIQPPAFNDCGALYRQRAPDSNVCKKPGEWQTYDITFRGARFDAAAKKIANARITVVHNGVTIHKDVEIQDKTGAGKPEGPEPGPILLQDHGSKVRFRNIWIVPERARNE